MFLGGQPCPNPRGGGPSVPKLLGPPTQYEKQQPDFDSNQSRCEEGRPRMLTSDLFVVANLVSLFLSKIHYSRQ